MFDADSYSNPLVDRYASKAMVSMWSPQKKFSTWRQLWIALAESEMELGLDITQEQVDQLRATASDIDFEAAAAHEKELRHDVMAHVHTWRDQVPASGGIIHLGATSCYVTDNTDAILLRESLDLVLVRLRAVIANLKKFCLEQAERPCVGYTHFQPAQFTTVGKRAALWLQDLVLDHTELEQAREAIRFRGVKGTTGTQDSFMKLFANDEDKVEELDRRVTSKMGFDRRFIVTGQTYTRKMDSRVVSALSAVGQSLAKFSNDIRLRHLREIEEPFEKKQIGSSAMAYKRNPMRCERIGSLSRFLISQTENTAYTEAGQWLERTLDDSANRRLSLPLAFMAADAILIIAANVTDGLVVRDAVIERHLREHVPFIASEELMMKAAAKGGDRQELHEVIRTHAMAAADKMKNEGGANDFLERVMGDDAFDLDRAEAEELMDASRFIGRAPSQVRTFIAAEVDPILDAHKDDTTGCGRTPRLMSSELLTSVFRHTGITAAIQIWGAVDEIVGLGVGLIEIEVGGGAGGIGVAQARLKKHRAICTSVSLFSSQVEPWRSPHLLHDDSEKRTLTRRAFTGAIESAARLKTRRVVLNPGFVTPHGYELLALKLNNAVEGGDWEEATKITDEIRKEHMKLREEAAEELCRVFHSALREHDGLEVHLVPSIHPLGVLDVDVAEWLLSDLGAGCSLRLDIGAIVTRERLGLSGLKHWAERFAGRIPSIYLSEPHGFRTDLPPGIGAVDWPMVHARLSPQTTSMLKVDPASSTVAVSQAIRSYGEGRSQI